MKDWSGNSKSTFVMLGASNHSEKEREQNDFYATEPKALEIFLEKIKEDGIVLHNKIWECACGKGHLSEVLKKKGYDVVSTDLIDRGYGDDYFDFLKYESCFPLDLDIVTNPPYKYAKEFIEHAMKLIPDGCRVFMFLKVQFLEGKARKELFKKYPPKCVYVSSSRILCAKNAKFDEMRAGGGSAVAYAWYEFEKGYSGKSELKWIN